MEFKKKYLVSCQLWKVFHLELCQICIFQLWNGMWKKRPGNLAIRCLMNIIIVKITYLVNNKTPSQYPVILILLSMAETKHLLLHQVCTHCSPSREVMFWVCHHQHGLLINLIDFVKCRFLEISPSGSLMFFCFFFHKVPPWIL